MRLLYCITISIVCSKIFVHSLNAGRFNATNGNGRTIYSINDDNSDRDGSRKVDDNTSNQHLCVDHICVHPALIALAMLAAFGGVILIILFARNYCQADEGRPSQTNAKFVKGTKDDDKPHTPIDINLFKTGIWICRYLQAGVWHGPHYYSVSFDSRSFKVTGFGIDNVGTFLISGIYSNKTGRIALKKRYQIDTGDASTNLGHRVTVQLAWNSNTCQFEGKWYMQTVIYLGEDEFELKFYADPPAPSSFTKH